MLFDTTHILYILISSVISAIFLFICSKFITSEHIKIKILRFSAVITVIIHFSNLWIDFFTKGQAVLQESQLFPIHPCNVIMWMLIICAFIKTDSKVFTILSEFCFWGGIVCGSIGILLNTNYANTPSLLDYEILKGLVSHSTMLFGCIYLLVGGFVKIRVFNTLSVALGLAIFIVDGLIINTLYSAFNIPACNSMYLLELPFPSMPWLTPLLMGIVGILIVFISTCLYELRLEKTQRWYNKLRVFLESKNNIITKGK